MNSNHLSVSSFLLGLLATACTSNKSLEQEQGQPSAEKINRAAVAPAARKPAYRLAALDTAHFSPAFIEGLKQSIQGESYAVRGKWLILSNIDSIAFPADLPAQQPVTYAATAKGRTYQLTVTRRNYSTIDYNAEVKKAGQTLARTTGTADLNPSFYTAAKVPVDTRTQTVYGAYEFLPTDSKQQKLTVLIGIGKDVDKAEIYASELPAWRDAPTLRRK